MPTIRKTVLALTLAVVAAAGAVAQVSDDVVRVGVLTDLTGPYADFAGPGSVVAARMAAEDHGGQAMGKPIEVIGGGHQNKPDVGAALARRWVDTERVDMVVTCPTPPWRSPCSRSGASATSSSSTLLPPRRN
ncbi:hypothetical protein GCM10009416_09340 [Craurococcus roseus]|uniref:Leucine-binding protein domain-containing protein n=1 Tax=Craurococcus roseus TaxID=77585 RepID=A0ABN1ERR8_9PROT